MSRNLNDRPAPKEERSQKSLWVAIAGLVISVFSFSMNDLMIGDVVFYLGLCVAAIGILYWILQPRHGI